VILNSPALRDLADELENLIKTLMVKYRPISIFIGGSLAKSRFVRGLSDIDILVITDHGMSKYDRFMLKAIKDVDVEITVYTLSEVMESLKRDNFFIIDTIKNGIEVYGNLRKRLRGELVPNHCQ